MTSFRTFGEWRTIQELGLASRVKQVSLEEAIADPNFDYPLELHGLWLLMPITASGEIPHFKHVRPHTIGSKLLPSMFIMDVENCGQEFRWRLFGTEHAQRFGGEVTGRRLSTVARFEPSAAASLPLARQCCETGKPIFFHTEYFDETGIVKETASIVMPLWGDNRQVERLFGCSVWC